MNRNGSSPLAAHRIAALLVALAAVTGGLLTSQVVAAWGMGSLSAAKGPGACLSNDKADLGSCQYGRAVGGAPSVTSPDGKNLYVVAYPGDSVAVLHRNPATGAIAQKRGSKGCLVTEPGANHCGPARGIEEATGIAISPDGKNLYVAGEESNSVAVFRRNARTGLLTQPRGKGGCVATGDEVRGCTRAPGLKGASLVAISPDGKNAYVYTDEKKLLTFDRNSATGTLTERRGAAGCAASGAGGGCTAARGLANVTSDILVSRDGKAVYVTSIETGNRTKQEATGLIAVFGRDPATGTLTQLAGAAGCLASSPSGGTCGEDRAALTPNGIAESPDGRQVYVASVGSQTLSIFDRDPVTGALTEKTGPDGCISYSSSFGCLELGDFQFPQSVTSVVVSPDGRSVYVGNTGPQSVVVFDRDPASGVLRRQPGTGGCVAKVRTRLDCVRASTSKTFQVEVSPDGRNVYAIGFFPATVVTLVRSTS